MKRFYILIFFICLWTYFTYHLFQGERGVFSLQKIKEAIKLSECEKMILMKKKDDLERNVSLLRSNNLDLDILSEEVIKNLNFVHEDDLVFINND